MIKKKILGLLVIIFGLIGFCFIYPGMLFNFVQKVERDAGGLKQRTIDVKGLHIGYLEGGKGDTLVLLHGFGANKDSWTKIGKYLTPYFRVIAPDLPGFGESSRDPDGDYSISAQTKRVKEFVRALKIKKFHLGGHSMGGNIAGAYAASYPNDLKSLLLIAPAGVASSKLSEMDRQLNKGKPNPLLARDTEEYERLLDFVFERKHWIPHLFTKVLAHKAIGHEPLNRKIFNQLHHSKDIQPLEVLLKGLPVTTLIVWGDKDRVIHMSGAKILKAVMPNATVAVMNTTGHIPMMEKQEETASLYLKFLKSNSEN